MTEAEALEAQRSGDIRFAIPNTPLWLLGMAAEVRSHEATSVAFQAWFEGSKVVDAEGKPLVVYHGTGSAFSRFDLGKALPSQADLGRDPPRAFYFSSSPKVAGGFAVDRTQQEGQYSLKGRQIMPVYLSLKNPLVIGSGRQQTGRPFRWQEVLPRALRQAKHRLPGSPAGPSPYDGVIFHNVLDSALGANTPSTIYIAFEPTQIKSATGNRGTFDPSNPDIRFAIPRVDQLGFFSQAEKAALESPQKSYRKNQVRPRLKKYGTKDEELDWMGLDEWLRRIPKGQTITKDELLDFIHENPVVVGERLLGGLQTRPQDVVEAEQRVVVAQAQHAQSRGETEHANRLFAQAEELTLEIERGAGLVPEGETLHGAWQEPGGENYRELLLTLPGGTPIGSYSEWLGRRLGVSPGEAEERAEYDDDAIHQTFLSEQSRDTGSYTSHAFGTPNILVWIRFNERTDADGNRVLFIEEIQSDWHQDGRKKGYAGRQLAPALDRSGWTADHGRGGAAHPPGRWAVYDGRDVYQGSHRAETAEAAIEAVFEETQSEYRVDREGSLGLVPDAPFKTSWPTLAVKRMIRWAAENGFDSITWTTGAMQVNRYENATRKVVDHLEWGQLPEGATGGWIQVEGFKGGSRVWVEQFDKRGVSHDGKTLENYLGKDLAKRILEELNGELDGDQITIGGKGMEDFYDKRLVKTFGKIGKAFGAKVGRVLIGAKPAPGRLRYEVLDSQGNLYEAFPTMEGALQTARDGGRFWTVRDTADPDLTLPVHSLPITDAMRESVTQVGFERFAVPAAATLPDSWMTATGDVVSGDTIRFTEGVFSGSWKNPVYSGDREIVAEVLSDSYGAKKQQHTFTLKVLSSTGKSPLEAEKSVKRKGRVVYRNGTERLTWEDEAARVDAANEKHGRGDVARRSRDDRRGERFAVPKRPFVGFDIGQERSFWGIPVDKWIRGFADKDLRVLRLEQAMDEAGAAVGHDESVYRSIERLPGRVSGAIRRWRLKRLDPLLSVLAEAGISSDAFAEFLYARHAEERDKYITAQDPDAWVDRDVPPSGMTEEEREAILAKVSASGQSAAYEKAGQMFDAIQQDTRRTQLALGLISQKTFDLWEEQYEHYVPLRTSYEDERLGHGGGVSIRGPEAMRAKGRGTLAHDPFTYSLLQAQRAIVRGHKNEVGHAFLALVTKHQKLLGIQIREEPEAHDLELGEMLPSAPLPTPYEFSTKVAGRQVYITVKDPLLRRALQNLGEQDMGPVIRFMAWINRGLSAINTSWDPGFIFSNFTRDLQTASIHLAGERSASLAASVFRWTLSGKPQRAVYRGLKGAEDSSDEWLSLFHRLERVGGLTGWYHARDVSEEAGVLQRDLSALSSTPAGQVRRALRGVGDLVDNLNKAVENGVRLAAFRAALEAGTSEKQAASLAKNLTVNFNRRGEWGATANAFYLFYNASVQGSMRVFQGLGNRRVQGMAAGIVASSMLLDAWNRSAGGDDEDGVPYYDKIPEWVKSRNLVVMDTDGSGDFTKIPLPYGYNVFHAIGQQISALRSGAASLAEVAKHLTYTVVESFSPIGSSGSILQTISPTLLDPISQIAENQTFYGAPLRPTAYDRLTPDSQLYWSSVSPVARASAEWINNMTGGDAVIPGAVDISPESIEHIAEFATGGVGRLINRAQKVVASVAQGEEVLTRDIPVVRRFRGSKGEGYDRELYISQRDDVLRADRQVKKFAGEPARLQTLVEDRAPQLRLVPAMKRAESKLRKLRKMRRIAVDAGASKSDLLPIDRRIRAIQAAFSKKYGALGVRR